MSTAQRKLTKSDLAQAFREGDSGASYPPILDVVQLAGLLRISKSTIYEWVCKGRLDGAFRKRGKHLLFWRDRVIELVFNGPEWKA